MNAHTIAASGQEFSKGQITITTRTADDVFVEIAMGAIGCGIKTENLDRIFDPFYDQVGATGQGLAMASLDYRR